MKEGRREGGRYEKEELVGGVGGGEKIGREGEGGEERESVIEESVL